MTNKMVKTVTINNGENSAIVKVHPEGEIEVVGMANTEEVTSDVTEQEVIVSAESQGIPVLTQSQVDEYLELHAQKAALEAKMKKIKPEIVDYMNKNQLKEVKGTKGKRVCFVDATASNSTSRYTDYELNEVAIALQGTKLLPKVTEIRVNADKLNGLIKVEKLPEGLAEQIKGLKIKNPGTPRFSVKN